MSTLDKKLLEPYMRNKDKAGATSRHNSPKSSQKFRNYGMRLNNVEGGSSLNFESSFQSPHEVSTMSNGNDTLLPPVN